MSVSHLHPENRHQYGGDGRCIHCFTLSPSMKRLISEVIETRKRLGVKKFRKLINEVKGSKK